MNERVWLETTWKGLELGLPLLSSCRKQSGMKLYSWRNHVWMSSICCFDDVSCKAKFCSLEFFDCFVKMLRVWFLREWENNGFFFLLSKVWLLLVVFKWWMDSQNNNARLCSLWVLGQKIGKCKNEVFFENESTLVFLLC